MYSIPKIHHLQGERAFFGGRFLEDYLLDQGDSPDLRVIPHFETALLASIAKQENGFPNAPNAGIKDVLSVVRRYIRMDERNLVKVFSTIKRPLDFHGVDCFFYYREKAVLVDVTRNPRKFRIKSHLVLTDDVIGSNDLIEDFAKEVVRMLLSKTHYHLPENIAVYINKKYCGY